MKLFDVIVIGEALKDIMFKSSELTPVSVKQKSGTVKHLLLPHGEKLPIKELFVNYGGSALNVAVGLKNFNVQSAPLASIGRDQVGAEMVAYLKKNSIDASLLNVSAEAKTGFSLVMYAGKALDPVSFPYVGANANLKLPSLRWFTTKWFYVASLPQSDWAGEMAKVVAQVKRGVNVAWNPGKRELTDARKVLAFLPHIALFILNKDEAKELVAKIDKKIAKKDLGNTKILLRALRFAGAKKVVITQGEKGASACDEFENYYYYPSQSDKKKIVDTVGAGDAFASGLLAGIIKWQDFDKAMQLAIKNSARVLYLAGAQNGLLKIKL